MSGANASALPGTGKTLRLELEMDDGSVVSAERTGPCRIQWYVDGEKVRPDDIAATEDYLQGVSDALHSMAKYRRKIIEDAYRNEIERYAERWADLEQRFEHIERQREQLRSEIEKAYADANIPGRHATLRYWRLRTQPSSEAVPDPLRDVPHVRRLETDLPCHVYFLLHKGEVVYVGQTASGWPSRIEQHVKAGDKEFDDVWYIEVDRQSLWKVEQRLIRRFQPKYNIQFVGAR